MSAKLVADTFTPFYLNLNNYFIQILVLDKIDEEYRGRTMSFLMLIWGLLPIGVLSAGVGVDHWGPQIVLTILGIGLLLLGFITITTQKWIRTIE